MITHNELGKEKFSFSLAIRIFSISILIFAVGIISASDVYASKAPKDFVATLGPDQEVLDDQDPELWKQSPASGHATFAVDRDMTEMKYTIHFENLTNVVGIHIHNGKVGQNNHVHLVDIKETDAHDPEDFDPSGTIEGVIHDDDVCPNSNPDGVECSIHGLVNEILNHRAYLQVHTDDFVDSGNATQNTGPGDLFNPGEIRGQIYPLKNTIFDAELSADQEVLDDVANPENWENVTSSGLARFVMSDDLSHINYVIQFENLHNVVGIHLHNGAINENSHVHLFDIKETNIQNPEDFTPATLTGTIHDDDMCPGGHGDHDSNSEVCTVIGLMQEIQAHRVYVQVHTNDGINSQNTGPGDLINPGEIRGQIFPTPDCLDCLVNVENQILTIFKFETADMPFLADKATFLISPNPFSHNVGNEFVDPDNFGLNLIITDNDPLDHDPTLGVVELMGVNHGTYSILELRGPPGFERTDDPFSSQEIFGTVNSHIQVTNVFLDVSEITDPIQMERPTFDPFLFVLLIEHGAHIDGNEITLHDQMPGGLMANLLDVFAGQPPQDIHFQTIADSDWDVQTLFDTFGIPTYQAPSLTGANEDGAFIPPVFVTENDDGVDIVMSPVIEEVFPGTNLVLRLDGIENMTEPGKEITGISLPLDTQGQDVGVSLQIHDEPPAGFPELSTSIADTSLFLDFDFMGDLDFGDASIYSEPPSIHFNLPTSGTSCPTGVLVFLLNEDTMEWEAIDPPPIRDPSQDTIDSCGYTQPVVHFSSYTVGTGASGGTSGSSTSGGHSDGGGHSHGSGPEGGAAAAGSDSDPLGLGIQLSTGEEDTNTLQFGRTEGENQFEFGGREGQIQDFEIDPGAGGIVDDQLLRFGHRLTFASLTVLGAAADDSGYDFGKKFDGTRIIANVYDENFPIKYNLDGDLQRLQVDESSTSVVFYLDNVKQSEMQIRLPRDLVHAENDSFILLASASPETQVNYEIEESSDNFYTLKFEIPENTKTLTIVGTQVVPEFGTYAIIIMFIAMISVLFVKRNSFLNLRNDISI